MVIVSMELDETESPDILFSNQVKILAFVLSRRNMIRVDGSLISRLKQAAPPHNFQAYIQLLSFKWSGMI